MKIIWNRVNEIQQLSYFTNDLILSNKTKHYFVLFQSAFSVLYSYKYFSIIVVRKRVILLKGRTDVKVQVLFFQFVQKK